MERRYGLSQMLRYVIPGAIILLFACHFAYTVMKPTGYAIPWNVLGLLQMQLLIVFLFLLVSYFLGHFVQAYGLAKERRSDPRGWWYYSRRYLTEKDTDCSHTLQSHIRKAITDSFDLQLEGDLDEAESEKLHRDVYHLCHSSLIQAGKNQQAEVYRELDAFNQASSAVCKIGFLFFMAEALWYLLYLAWILFNLRAVFVQALLAQSPHVLGLIISVVLAVILLEGGKFFERRYERTARGLVETVFKNFYVQYLDGKAR